MRNGIHAGPVDGSLLYAVDINNACVDNNWFPELAYAIATIETIATEISGWLAQNYPGKTALDVITGDGIQVPYGYGLFQETPQASGLQLIPDWMNAYAACKFAILNHLAVAEVYWVNLGYQGDNLKRCIASEYNGGRSKALRGHAQGNVGLFTTPGPDGTLYPDRVLLVCNALENGTNPYIY